MFIKALHNFLVSTEQIKYLLNGNLYYYKPNCYLKAHQQISEKWCLGKYCSCDKACQFLAFRGGSRDFENGGRSMSATMVGRRRKF